MPEMFTIEIPDDVLPLIKTSFGARVDLSYVAEGLEATIDNLTGYSYSYSAVIHGPSEFVITIRKVVRVDPRRE